MTPDEISPGELSPWERPHQRWQTPGEEGIEETVEAIAPPPAEPLTPGPPSGTPLPMTPSPMGPAPVGPASPVRRVRSRPPGATRGPITGPLGDVRPAAQARGPIPAGRLDGGRGMRGGRGARGSFRVADQEHPLRHEVSRWMGVAGLALVTGLLILAWSAVQLTERARATQVLAETLAPLSDIDRLLERDYETLQATAQESDGTSVIVRSYPLGVAIPAAELSEMSAAQVRAWVLSASAERIYDTGMGTFAREDGVRGSFFSPRGVFELTAGQLTARNHTIAIIVSVLLALFFVPMVVRTLSDGSGGERARNLGAGVLVGGLGLAGALLIGRALLRGVVGADDIFADALLQIGSDVAGLPVRNGLIFGALGAVVLAGSVAGSVAGHRAGPQETFEALLWRWAGHRLGRSCRTPSGSRRPG